MVRWMDRRQEQEMRRGKPWRCGNIKVNTVASEGGERAGGQTHSLVQVDAQLREDDVSDVV
jgi:hypothetical protein